VDGATVTITLDEYNQLRDSASVNRFLLDKITFYEARMIDIEQKLNNLNDRMLNLEIKVKS
jgi:hypothetical protein